MRSKSEGYAPSRRWRLLAAGLAALLFVVLDRVTKLLVQAHLSPRPFSGDSFEAPFIPGVVRLYYVENRGAAFSLGEGSGWLFVLVALLVTVAAVVYLRRAPLVSRVEVIGLGMVVGGGIGNAIDRMCFGYVVDFLATEFIDFPVFNVADIGITCGVVIAFLGFMFLSPANALEGDDAGAKAAGGSKDDNRGGGL